MRSIILYAYKGEMPGILTDYDQVRLPNDRGVYHVFVRAQVVEGDVGTALNLAGDYVREDEIVLNTIPYPGEPRI